MTARDLSDWSDDETAGSFTARAGSRLEYWKPSGFLEGIIEVHPDFPPRLHYLDGRASVDLVPVDEPVYTPLDPINVHEHPPLIVGQEYPRFVRPIRPPDITIERRWKIPDTKDLSAETYVLRQNSTWTFQGLQNLPGACMSITKVGHCAYQ